MGETTVQGGIALLDDDTGDEAAAPFTPMDEETYADSQIEDTVMEGELDDEGEDAPNPATATGFALAQPYAVPA